MRPEPPRAGRVRALLMALGVLCAGCHAVKPTPTRKPSDLAGLHLPLVRMETLRLVVTGSVGTVPAQMGLALSQPLTTISRGCFPNGTPAVRRRIRVPRISGGFATFSEIRVDEARIGETELGPFPAGLSEGTGCRVMLGSDRLEPYAVSLDLASREVAFDRSGAAASETSRDAGADEVVRIRLARAPTADWLLVSARLRQGDAEWVGPFALATLSARSRISRSVATSSGIESTAKLFRSLHIPRQLDFFPHMERSAILDGIELSPGLVEPSLLIGLDEGWHRSAPSGVLGSDVWGRFDATFDPLAHLLVLRRPKVVGHGEASRCGRPGLPPNAEACFALSQSARARGVWASTTLWRALPRGGRIYLDAVGKEGAPQSLGCAFGWTFPPSGPGEALSTPFPWPGLARALPGCARALSGVHRVRFGLWQAGALHRCPARCAFAEDLRTHRLSCHCPRQASGAAAALAPLLHRARELLHTSPAAAPGPDEP